MDLCMQCGVASVDEAGTRWCEKYQMAVGTSGEGKETCQYFIEPQYEDEELLSPKQHLWLVENVVASRKMRGPV